MEGKGCFITRCCYNYSTVNLYVSSIVDCWVFVSGYNYWMGGGLISLEVGFWGFWFSFLCEREREREGRRERGLMNELHRSDWIE